MAKQIARLLKADIQESSDLKSIAKMLSKKGRGGDTMLAHITPKEAKILKEAGGAGTVNPDTGLLEFYDWSGGYGTTDPESSYTPSRYTPSMGDWSGYSTPDTSFVYNAAVQGGGDAGASFRPFEASGGYTPNFADFGAASDMPVTPFTSGAATPAAPEAAAAAYPQGMMDIPADVGATAMRTPTDIFMAGQAPAGMAAGGEITPTQPGLSQRAGDILKAVKEGGGDVLEFLKKNPDLVRLSGAGVGAVTSAQRIKQAGQQIQQATQEQKQISQPYTKAGQELQRAAMAGELTPQSAQAYQALRAQMAQGIESRGGVGVAQAQAQLEAFRQNLLQNQYNYGLQVAQIGDQIALGAIKTGLQLDQNLQQLAQQYTSNLLAIAGGISPTAGATTARTQP